MKHLIEYKRLNAQTKHVLKKAQKKSWADFCSSLDFRTPRSKIWKFLKKMKGKFNSSNFPLTKDGALLKNNKEKADLLAEHYKTKMCNREEFQSLPEFEEKILEVGPPELESPFTEKELETVLNHLKNEKAMGEDMIPNEFIKNLPANKRE